MDEILAFLVILLYLCVGAVIVFIIYDKISRRL
jgi:hypothetical protein